MGTQDCLDVGCREGGVCEDTGICTCPEGFAGDLCEINLAGDGS